MYFLTDISDPLKWTDYSQALDYYDEALADCECSYARPDCDNDGCMDEGSRWSVIIKFNFFMFCLMALNGFISSFGAHVYRCRSLASLCFALLCLLNLAAIVTTACFRFNTMGKLAALSTQSTKYQGLNDEQTRILITNDRTYESDAQTITWLFSIQILYFLSNCA